MTDEERLRAAADIVLQQAPFLRSRGVLHASIVGSVADKRAGSDSDLDILIHPDPQGHMTIYDLVDIRERLSDSYGSSVDVISAGALTRRHRLFEETAIRVF